MQNIVGSRIAHYLDENRSSLIESWLQKVIVDPDDPNRDFVRLNGSLMLNMAIASAKSLFVDEEHLRQLAYKVSLERTEANANIGDFVYNVTLGRSKIFEHLPRIGLSLEQLQPVLQVIDELFDKFLYFAVHHYTTLRDRQLVEQADFIDQSHKDKMTILGQMSASFVHEFRNPLTSVIGFVHLLQEKYPSLEYVDIINRELDELKFRVNQFLLASKGDHPLSKPKVDFEIAPLVDETLVFLYPMIVSVNVSFYCAVDERIRVSGYPDEFRQVLINILMNSLDALLSSSVGIIGITGVTERDRLILSISNNGPVIPEHMRATIFEPFVSTKELGTGIGLYVCRKIIQKHHGSIECESNDDLTTFRIIIPTKSISDATN